jgi:hypothetical protein
MQGDEVKHQMKFNVSASLLDELLQDLSLIPFFLRFFHRIEKMDNFQPLSLFSQAFNLNSMPKKPISINAEKTV